MTKEIIEVDKERGIMRCTTVDERWYARTINDPITGLPTWDYVPSVTWICEQGTPKGVGFYKWLAKHGWDEAQALKESAGDRGSKVHYAAKALIDGETVTMQSEFFNDTLGRNEPLTLDEYEALMSFCAWFAEAKPEVIDREYCVWNEVHRYAGTVDLKLRLSEEYIRKNKLGSTPETVWGIDLKTSQGIWLPMELQLSAYRAADPTIERMAILQLGYRRNKARFKFTEVEDKFELFVAARQIWANECANEKPLQRDFPLSLSLPSALAKAERA